MEKFGRAREATDDNTTRRMRLVFWLTKGTDTHSVCNLYQVYLLPGGDFLAERGHLNFRNAATYK